MVIRNNPLHTPHASTRIPTGLPSIGAATLTLLRSRQIETLQDVLRAGPTGHEHIPGLGPAKWAVLEQWMRDTIDLNSIREVVRIAANNIDVDDEGRRSLIGITPQPSISWDEPELGCVFDVQYGDGWIRIAAHKAGRAEPLTWEHIQDIDTNTYEFDLTIGNSRQLVNLDTETLEVIRNALNTWKAIDRAYQQHPATIEGDRRREAMRDYLNGGQQRAEFWGAVIGVAIVVVPCALLVWLGMCQH